MNYTDEDFFEDLSGAIYYIAGAYSDLYGRSNLKRILLYMMDHFDEKDELAGFIIDILFKVIEGKWVNESKRTIS